VANAVIVGAVGAVVFAQKPAKAPISATIVAPTLRIAWLSLRPRESAGQQKGLGADLRQIELG